MFLAATLQLTMMQVFKSSISAPRAPGLFSRPVVQRCLRCSATKRVIEPAYFPVSGGRLDWPRGSLHQVSVHPPTTHPAWHRRRAQEVFSGAAERVFASGGFLKREEVSEGKKPLWLSLQGAMADVAPFACALADTGAC